MKNFLLSTVLSLGILLSPNNGFSQLRETFFDFNTFEEQIQQVYTNEDNRLYAEDGVAIAEVGSSMFMLDNWLVTFTNAAGEDPFSKIDSYTKRVTSQEQGTVLGVRALFPEWPNASEAHIRPVFSLLPFQRTGEYANINNGVVTNIGAVKTFSMWVNGRNFPFKMGVRVRDLKDKLTEFTLGSLLYIGWRKLTHNNPTYSTRIFNNYLPPTRIYPSDIPLMRFETFVLYRQGNQDGGNFVGYFGSSEIEYTPYITEVQTDINDEDTWGIIRAEQEKLASALNGTLYEQILQYEFARQRVIAGQENNQENNQAGDQAAQDNNDANVDAAQQN